MKRLSACTAGALLLALSSVANAHSIWIEQNKGKAELYFGEYGDNLKEESPGRLDKIPKPVASVDDTKSSKDLDLTRGKSNYAIPGTYTDDSSITAEVKDYPLREEKEGDKVIGRSKWIAAARSIQNFKARTAKTTLDIVPIAGKKIALYFKGKPLPKAKLSLISPNGWMKEVQTDDKGETDLSPFWKGIYVVEARHTDETPGEANGEKFDKTKYTTTLSFLNTSGPATERPAATKPSPAS